MNVLGRESSREPKPSPPPFDVEAWVDNLVAQGFLDRDDLIAETTEALEDEGRATSGAVALVDVTIARHRALAASWPEATDCDRLDAAFAALEDAGIVARQDFACCGSCGFAEIGDEIGDPTTADGFVFYHRQDTEHAVDGNGLFLAYGAMAPGDAATAAVGRRVVDALAASGLSPAWDGSVDTRIRVPIDWKRRRAD